MMLFWGASTSPALAHFHRTTAGSLKMDRLPGERVTTAATEGKENGRERKCAESKKEKEKLL